MKTTNKKALVILILLFTTTILSAATKSQYFSKSVIITRVFPHKLGYKVFYMANDMKNREAYIPSKLFDAPPAEENDPATRSLLYKGYDNSYPYMTIFWKDGEFSHVKLYLHADFNDYSWGSFANPDKYDDNFKNAKLEFDF